MSERFSVARGLMYGAYALSDFAALSAGTLLFEDMLKGDSGLFLVHAVLGATAYAVAHQFVPLMRKHDEFKRDKVQYDIDFNKRVKDLEQLSQEEGYPLDLTYLTRPINT